MNRMIRGSIVIAGLALLAGCGSSEQGPNTTVDLAAAVGQSAWGDAASLPGASSVLGLPAAVTAPSVDPSSCPYSATSQSFVCPTRNILGLALNTSFSLLDASGHSQSSLNAATTTAVRTIVDAVGTVAVPSPPGVGNTIGMNHHSDLTLSGLQSATRTLNGTSHDVDTLVTTSGSTTTRSVVELTSTTTNLVMPANGATYPASGSITSDIATKLTIGSSPAVSATVHAVMTFNGTSLVTVAITSAGITHICQLDLAGGPPRC